MAVARKMPVRPRALAAPARHVDVVLQIDGLIAFARADIDLVERGFQAHPGRPVMGHKAAPVLGLVHVAEGLGFIKADDGEVARNRQC
ncbi:hypothetical protein D3C85_1507990 [compost metagenome]